MIDWKKYYWRSELQKLIKEVLKTKDMTLMELVENLKDIANISVHPFALVAILKVTDGIFIKTQIFSEAGSRMINVYSLLPLFSNVPMQAR